MLLLSLCYAVYLDVERFAPMYDVARVTCQRTFYGKGLKGIRGLFGLCVFSDTDLKKSR